MENHKYYIRIALMRTFVFPEFLYGLVSWVVVPVKCGAREECYEYFERLKERMNLKITLKYLDHTPYVV